MVLHQRCDQLRARCRDSESPRHRPRGPSCQSGHGYRGQAAVIRAEKILTIMAVTPEAPVLLSSE